MGEGEAREALERLAAGRVLVFRRFKGAYGLWEGSDVDLEGRLAEGLARVAPTARLAEVVERAWRPTPAQGTGLGQAAPARDGDVSGVTGRGEPIRGC